MLDEGPSAFNHHTRGVRRPKTGGRSAGRCLVKAGRAVTGEGWWSGDRCGWSGAAGKGWAKAAQTTTAEDGEPQSGPTAAGPRRIGEKNRGGIRSPGSRPCNGGPPVGGPAVRGGCFSTLPRRPVHTLICTSLHMQSHYRPPWTGLKHRNGGGGTKS